MIDRGPEIKKRLLPKDLISEDQVTEAFEAWRHTEYGMGWSDDMVSTAQRLVLEVFLPSMNSEGRTRKLWKEPYNDQSALYNKILENYRGKTINRLNVVAWAIARKLVKDTKKIKRTIISDERVVPGDPILTGRIGNIRCGATAPKDEEHFGLYDQGLYQADHSD